MFETIFYGFCKWAAPIMIVACNIYMVAEAVIKRHKKKAELN